MALALLTGFADKENTMTNAGLGWYLLWVGRRAPGMAVREMPARLLGPLDARAGAPATGLRGR